jgi:hypothetical protein
MCDKKTELDQDVEIQRRLEQLERDAMAVRDRILQQAKPMPYEFSLVVDREFWRLLA